MPGRGLRAHLGRWLRGEPIGVPTHALVVHFPAALLPTSLACDAVAWLRPELATGRAAVVMLVLGLAGGLVAAGTGLLDWADMIAGSARRARATRHLVVQAGALALFALSLALRGGALDAATAPPAALITAALGTVVLLAGNHLGGLLVYRDGMRVRSSRER
jgi:uncharacterized membrane protein